MVSVRIPSGVVSVVVLGHGFKCTASIKGTNLDPVPVHGAAPHCKATPAGKTAKTPPPVTTTSATTTTAAPPPASSSSSGFPIWILVVIVVALLAAIGFYLLRRRGPGDDCAELRARCQKLRADADGIITARMAEAGQVVAQAQPIYTLARDGRRDAVFNVHEWALTNVAADKGVVISLVSDPAVTTLGDVRELSPAVNPSTQTVTVKIGLRDTPAAMTLGALVNGTARLNQQKVVLVPWAALFEMAGRPAVWVLDPGGSIASRKPITIARYTKDQIAVSSGLQTGEIVVSAGVQMLHPGQKVEIANDRKPTGP